MPVLMSRKANVLSDRAAMRRNPQRPALKAAMASNYRFEPRAPMWLEQHTQAWLAVLSDAL